MTKLWYCDTTRGSIIVTDNNARLSSLQDLIILALQERLSQSEPLRFPLRSFQPKGY